MVEGFRNEKTEGGWKEMKKVVVIVLMCMLVSVIALASETGRGIYTTPIAPLTEVLNTNEYFYHGHGYDQTSKYKAPLGGILDLWLWKEDVFTIPTKIGTSGQYDANNGVWGAFVKVDMDATGLMRALFGVE